MERKQFIEPELCIMIFSAELLLNTSDPDPAINDPFDDYSF